MDPQNQKNNAKYKMKKYLDKLSKLGYKLNTKTNTIEYVNKPTNKLEIIDE
jgi:hypothetical protein